MHTGEDYEKTNEDENDYSDFYNTEEEEPVDDGHKKKTIIKIIIIVGVVLLIALIVVLILVFRKEKPVDFSLSFENATGVEWSKENVTINVNIPEEKNVKSVKYTINCTENCEYADVVDKKILISNSGSSKVVVVVTNNDDIENVKDIVVKVDNAPPQVSLSYSEKEVKSSGPVTVCAICIDNESGCKQEQVCKEYTKTSKDQTLTVEDNVGNTATSNKFTVTIGSSSGGKSNTTTSTLSCALSIDKNGVVTATKHGSNVAYYGFSASYSGSNETKKQLSSDEQRNLKKVSYYVKGKDGKTLSCSININCYCKYPADDKHGGECYRELEKSVVNPKAGECDGAVRENQNGCTFLKNKGLYCEKA